VDGTQAKFLLRKKEAPKAGARIDMDVFTYDLLVAGVPTRLYFGCGFSTEMISASSLLKRRRF
jgi:hypothetical protein